MKVDFQGKQIEANEIEVINANERWNEYQLADGKVLMLKLVLVGVQLLDAIDEKTKTPIFQYQTQIISRVK